MREFQRSLVGVRANRVAVSAGPTKIECSDAAIAKQIIDRFSSSSTFTTSTFQCHDSSWSVGKCGEGIEISVKVGGRSAMCTCRTDTIAIRPCVNNQNWGGLSPNVCNSDKITLRMTVVFLPPTAMPTETPTPQPTTLPTETPTTPQPTTLPTEIPTAHPTLPPTAIPTETPTTQPTTIPTGTPTTQPTTMPTQTPSALPTLSLTAMPTVHVDLISDFDIIDKNADGSLNYDEIVFAIADTNKDHKLSLKEYEAARADRLFIDTKYTVTNSSVVKISDDVDLSADFHTIDRNGDGFLNYDEIAFAIVDIKKNGKLSLEEYEAARADRIFVDTSYKPE